MPSFNLEDTHGNTYTETTRKHLPARLVNECEAKYNAEVKATRNSETGSVGNVMQARSDIKDRVIEWLNDKDFENDLGPDSISPESQDKVLKQYQDYLPGISYKESGDEGTGNSDVNEQESNTT